MDLSKRKIKKILQKKEVVTVGEFIKKYYGDTVTPFTMNLFYNLYIRESKHLIVHDENYPITVERRK